MLSILDPHHSSMRSTMGYGTLYFRHVILSGKPSIWSHREQDSNVIFLEV